MNNPGNADSRKHLFCCVAVEGLRLYRCATRVFSVSASDCHYRDFHNNNIDCITVEGFVSILAIAACQIVFCKMLNKL